MIYNFTQIEDKGTHIKLSTSDGDSVSIPKDKFVSINDESGLVSIKTVGSRATIGTISEAIYEYEFKPAREKEVVLLLQNGTVERHTYDDGIIPQGEFKNRTDIVSTKVGEGITNIGSLAFYGCYGLTSVSIPISVETISSNAFGNCSGLTKAEFSSLDALLNTDFAGDNSNPLKYAHHLYIDGREVTELVIPYSVTIVNKYSFIGGSYITSVTIPSSVTEIGVSAFYGCDELQSVTLSEGLTKIGANAFSSCRKIKTITIPSTVTYLGTYSLGNYNVAESARTVLDVVYMLPTTPPSGWNRYDPSIELSRNGVIIVGCSVEDTYKTDSLWGIYKTSIFCDETYYGSMVKLKLTNGTTEEHFYKKGKLPVNAFANRTDIAEAKIGDYITSYEAGGSGNRAFYNCTNLSKIEFGSGLTTLPYGVCEGCTSLTDVIIPEGVLQTGTLTFKGCTSLTSVDLPESIEVIGETNNSWSETFMYSALSSITIPQSVTRMMINVFRFCDDLQYIELLPTTPPTIYNGTFNGIPSTCIFYVPSESVETYKAASVWSNYANRIQAIP